MSPKLKKSFRPIKTGETKRTNHNADQIPLYLNKRGGICYEFRAFYAQILLKLTVIEAPICVRLI